MKERPILFSGPMVRAILAGSKSQMRLIIRSGEVLSESDGRKRRVFNVNDPSELTVVNACLQLPRDPNPLMRIASPFKKGRNLWVREAWRADEAYDLLAPRDVPEGSPTFMEASAAVWRCGAYDGAPGKLRPSMFMPRWASRITLEITGVRVERLQDISEADARAEGAPPSHESIDRISREFGYADFPRSWYAQLWDSINGPGSWEANPLVWVVEFRRIEKDAA